MIGSSGSKLLSRALVLAPLLIVAAFPLFGIYNPSDSTLWYYDFLSMNNKILWLMLALVGVSLIAMIKHHDLPLPSLFAVVIFFSIAEVWSNYPMLWRDLFLHGSAVSGILQRGRIDNTWFSYPQNQPGFFLLWSIASKITGFAIFESNLFVLLPVSVFSLTLLLVLIFRAFHIEIPNAATLLAFLIMNFNWNEYMFVHFNTRLLSLIYVLVFVLFFLRVEKGRRSFMLFTVNLALVISHVLNALVPIAFLGIYWLVERRRVHQEISLFASCATVYLAWNLYQAYSLLGAGLSTLLNHYYVLLALDIAGGWVPSGATTQPPYGPLIGDYYKALLVCLGFISLYALTKLRKNGQVRILAAYLFSALTVYGISFFSILTWISAHRGIIFGSIALAGLPTLLLSSSPEKRAKSWKRSLLVAVLIVMIIPHFILVHEQPYARMLNTHSVGESSSFILNHRNGQTIVTANDFPFYYAFYEPFYQGYESLDLSHLTSLNNVTSFFDNKTGLKVVDSSQVLDWSLTYGHATSFDDGLTAWYRNVYTPLDDHLNRIYTTSYETIYD